MQKLNVKTWGSTLGLCAQNPGPYLVYFPINPDVLRPGVAEMDAKANCHTTMAMHDMTTPPPPRSYDYGYVQQ